MSEVGKDVFHSPESGNLIIIWGNQSLWYKGDNSSFFPQPQYGKQEFYRHCRPQLLGSLWLIILFQKSARETEKGAMKVGNQVAWK